MVIRRKRQTWITLGIIFWLFFGAGEVAAQTSKMPIAASILPLADFCRQIGGDKVDVQVLIPAGASPHIFEPSPGKLKGVTKAKVLVHVGAGLEPWLERFLQTMPGTRPVPVEAAHGLELITEIPGSAKMPAQQMGHQHGGEAGHEHHYNVGNPHIWLDPVLAQGICLRIAAAFVAADPAQRAVYEQNLATYLEALADLHQKIVSVTAGFRIREFVSFHPSFTYFARRYQLREIGVIEVAPGREPTPRVLKNIVAAIGRYGIRVIFSEPQYNPRLAEVLAQEAGVRVLTLDPLGGRLPYGDNYIAMMHHNLETMAAAMQ